MLTGVEAALEASEEFSRVAMLRLTPQLLDADVTGKRCLPQRQERPACRTGMDDAWPGNGG